MPTVDFNLILNGITLLGLLVLGPRAFRTANLRAQLAAKDEVIRTNMQSIDSLETRISQLEGEVKTLTVRSNQAEQARRDAETTAATWEARYTELSHYAAQPAVEHFEAMMKQHSETVAERHERMLAQLGTLTLAIGKVAEHVGIGLG
jgi:uncharacterized protein (DUF3084 family)